jgi:hypothetical protein
VDVLRKTLVKMSEDGKRHALALDLHPDDAALLAEALES